MKNTFKKLFFFVLASATVVSCDLGSEDEPNFGNGPFVAQFPYATSTGYFLKDEGVVYPYDVPVELVGGNGLAVSQDIVLSYEVDMENSTAVEGVNFDFVNDTNTATIPAGNAFSTIPIVIYSATLDDQDPPVLVLKLTEVTAEGVNVVASGSQGTIALTLQGTCSSDLAGMYNLVVTRTSSPGTYNLPGEAIIAHGTGQYLTDSTGPYNNRGLVSAGAQLGTPSAGFLFNEVCGRVALVTDQNLGGALGGGYSNSVYQTPAQYANSTIDGAGVITIEYSVFFAAGDASYRGVYTPIP